MRWLEVRRHSLTKKGEARGRGSHLSTRGVALARTVGAELGAFAYVVTSSSPRAIETSIAMGYAVDDAIHMPSGYVSGEVEHHDQWRWPLPYLRYAGLVGQGGGLAGIAAQHQGIWARAIDAVPDGAAVLVVSHGGSIEPTLVACLLDADHRVWGAPLGHCDGARLGFDDSGVVGVQFLRAPALSN